MIECEGKGKRLMMGEMGINGTVLREGEEGELTME